MLKPDESNVQSLTDMELGDLVESVAWFTRNYDEHKAYENHDMRGPMGPKQVMESLQRLVRTYKRGRD